MIKTFLNKPVKVVKQDGFVLYGIVLEYEQFGIWLQTKQKTSFITYQNIKGIDLDERL